MAENSGIEWTDNTFNPWMGCTKVSPACKFCYAERDFDHRYGKVKWGPSGTRVVTSDTNWRKPLKWNRQYIDSMTASAAGYGPEPQRPRVFCASLADVFEDWGGDMRDHKGNPLWKCNGIDTWQSQCLEFRTDSIMREHCTKLTMNDVRARLFKLIDATPNLDWLILTKRPESILRMWPAYFPGGYIAEAGSMNQEGPRHNVWLGTSVENQEYADKRIPELLKCSGVAPVLFLSCEPLLGLVDLNNIQVSPDHDGIGPNAISDDLLDCLSGELCSGETGCVVSDTEPTIDWIITGGESGSDARPCDPDWFRSLRDQCAKTGTPFHFKQWGEWDAEQERVGKKAAGRLLDGCEHNGLPRQKTLA